MTNSLFVCFFVVLTHSKESENRPKIGCLSTYIVLLPSYKLHNDNGRTYPKTLSCHKQNKMRPLPNAPFFQAAGDS